MGEQGCCCLNTWQIRLPPEYWSNPSHTSDGPTEADGKTEGESYRFWCMCLTGIGWVWSGRLHRYITKQRSNNDLSKLLRDSLCVLARLTETRVGGAALEGMLVLLKDSCKHVDTMTHFHYDGLREAIIDVVAFQGRDIGVFIGGAGKDF